MTTLELAQYYANLLIFQYAGKTKAYGTIQALASRVIMPQTTVQEITFTAAPTSGTFVLSYDGNSSAAINWNDSNSTIQTKIQAIPELSDVLVTGELADQLLVGTFVGVIPPAMSLEIVSNSLQPNVTIAIAETDLILPLAVQNAFNLLGEDLASGVQLDTIGKYAGVVRSGVGQTGPITLGDSDFLTLIRFAIIINSAQSDLSTIVNSIFQFFGYNVLVFDYQNMHMSYLISSAIGSQDLIQLLVAENLLPAPMTVQVSVIYAPIITDFFGFVTYQFPTAMNNTPFNTYEDYQMDWPWIDYSDALTPLTTLGTESGNIIVQENGDLIYLG